MGIRSFFSGLKKRGSRPRSPSENSKPVSIKKLLPSHSLRRYGSTPSSTNRIEDLKQVFRKFDINGDGKISWSELGSIMDSLGEQLSEQELKKMVKEADADGDEFIDLQEFMDLNVKDLDETAVIEDLRKAFMIFDVDGNGAISPEELCRVLNSLGEESTVADCRKMIRGADRDGDGLVNFEEFKAMMMDSSQG